MGNRLPNLKKIRKDNNMSQQEFSDWLGITEKTLRKYENEDISDMKAVHLLMISERFNVSVDYILGVSDYVSSDPNVKIASEYTGLSEDAIIELHKQCVYDEELALIVASANAIDVPLSTAIQMYHDRMPKFKQVINQLRGEVNSTDYYYHSKMDIISKEIAKHTACMYEAIIMKNKLPFDSHGNIIGNLLQYLYSEYDQLECQDAISDYITKYQDPNTSESDKHFIKECINENSEYVVEYQRHKEIACFRVSSYIPQLFEEICDTWIKHVKSIYNTH